MPVDPGNAQEAAAKWRNDQILIVPLVEDIPQVHAQAKAQVHRKFPRLGNIQVIRLPANLAVKDAIDLYLKSGLVRYAEPDWIGEPTATPNDPYFPAVNDFYHGQWGLYNSGAFGWVAGADIHAPQAWDYVTGAPDIVVAVLDSGLRPNHEDLRDNLWVNPAGAPFLNGINTIDDPPTGNITDTHGHGTTLAGVIGARGNNGLGVAGVAWQVKLMTCKAYDNNNPPTLANLVEGINFAVSNGADTLNISLAYGSTSDILRQAVAAARNYNVIVVAGAGNEALNVDYQERFPACFDLDTILSVCATDYYDNWISAWNYGPMKVDLGAPGKRIYTTYFSADNAYWGEAEGTSISSAFVSGAVAIMLKCFPFESYFQIENRILSSTTPLPTLAGRCVTGGRLNLYGAMASTLTAPPRNNNFANAATWTMTGGMLTAANNVDATKEPGEPNHAGNAGGKSVWWNWQPSNANPVTFTTAGSGFDTLLAVYTGNTVSTLTLVVADDDSGGNKCSKVVFTPNPNLTYRIAVDGFNGACGSLKLRGLEGTLMDPGSLRFVSGYLQRGPGTFQALMVGQPYSIVRVESSTDLFIWNSVATNVLDANGLSYYNDSSAALGHKYYRGSSLAVPDLPTQNAVGYVDLPGLTPGDSLVANPLITVNNRVSVLFGTVPNGTVISKWNESTQSYQINTYNGSWTYPDMMLLPGEGCVFHNPSATTLSRTIVGEVQLGFQNNATPGQFSLRSSIAPLAGHVRADLMFPVMNTDYVVKKVNGSDVTYTFNNGTWSPSEPLLAVGEGFWSHKSVGLNWYRNLLIWP